MKNTHFKNTTKYHVDICESKSENVYMIENNLDFTSVELRAMELARPETMIEQVMSRILDRARFGFDILTALKGDDSSG